ncbi:MAG: hypothetical protein P4L81_01365 [Candidatus Pacebacteria bacterium]|nr:hypothetical protein [Candidatus Paceibacterota bacterium]
MHKLWKVLRWTIIFVALVYAAMVIYAYPHVHQERLDREVVAQIEAQKITPDDVAGAHLAPTPDPNAIDATVQGVDANQNGIRDDVELAIFARHPTSSAIRAAELQYAMDLQTQLTQVTDTATWAAAEIQRERGFGCLYDTSRGEYSRFETETDALVINTNLRKERFDWMQQFGTSYKLSFGPDCDVSSQQGYGN